jgi:hypothetical protein
MVGIAASLFTGVVCDDFDDALGIASAFAVLWIRPSLEVLLPRGPSVARSPPGSFAVTAQRRSTAWRYVTALD